MRRPSSSMLAMAGAIVVLGPITGTLAWAGSRFALAGKPSLAALCAAGAVASPFVLTAILAWLVAAVAALQAGAV